MTLSVENQFPAPDATDVSTTISPSFSVVTDDVDSPVTKSSLNVWVNGTKFVSNGVPVPGSRVEDNGLGGLNIVIDPKEPFPERDPITIRVTATGLDTSWSFTIGDTRGPILAEAKPPPGSISTASPPTLFLRFADPGTGYQVAPTVADFVANPANLEAGSNQISFEPSVSGKNFVGREGRLIEVNSGVDAGQRRRIVSVQGPGLATYDGAPLTGTAESVTVFDDLGLDIHVDDVRVVHSGFPDVDAAAAGWTAVVTDSGEEVEATLTPPSVWSPGDRVRVRARIADTHPTRRNVSDIGYFFDVVDTRGPQVVNVSPVEGARGIPTSPSPDSDIAFDVVSGAGVDSGNLNVWVNGAAAISSGTPTGDWSNSTITAITNGYRVVLKKSTAYVDGKIVFVEIESRDSNGRFGERRVLRFHFGTAVDDATVNAGLSSTNVIKAIAFDLSHTSFADPIPRRHTGFAWDGYWYNNGNKTAKTASWFTELGAFPISGHIIVTDTGGWAIVKALDAGPWMTCAPATSPAWSMADNDAGPINDADFGPDACLTLAGNNLLFVDFVEDRAERINSAGRTLSSGTISTRNSNQAGNPADLSYALPLGPYTAVASVREQTAEGRQLVATVASAGQVSLLTVLTEDMAAKLRQRFQVDFDPKRVVTRQVPGTIVRLQLAPFTRPDVITPMAIAYNEAGQGQVELWDWFAFGLLKANSLFLDDASTPALPAAEIRDLDMVMGADNLVLAAAMVGQVDVFDVDPENPGSATHSSYTEAELGLSGIAGAEISAVALEPGFRADIGHLYAAVAAAGDGRVTRFRIHSPSAADRAVTMASGIPFTTLSAIGTTRHDELTYVRTSMRIA